MATSGLLGKFGRCEVCNTEEAKYKCPRCEVKTCCLTCVKNHKTALECNGERNKVGYKPISQFTNLDLLSDYRLLEETSRRVERFIRDPSKHYTTTKPLPINLYKLRGAARGRRTSLQFLPHNFSRSKSNSTYFDWKEQQIYWRVEWIFPQAGNIKCIGRRLLENERLSKLLNTYLDPKLCDSLYLNRLQYYHSAGHSGVILLLKAEQKVGSRFYLLDPSLSLRSNLQGKTIIEFPTIYVVLKDHKDAFDIIGPDEEEDDRTKMGGNVVGKQKDENNFLFNSSASDSENEDKKQEQVKEDSSFGVRGRRRKYRRINIPHYDALIRQNS